MLSPTAILKAHGLYPQKRLGQNFLNTPEVAKTIIQKTGICQQDVILEIGAGLGALTIPVARTAAMVFAVEYDHHLIEPLQLELRAAGVSNVKVIRADILSLDLDAIIRAADNKLIVMGNLPYNISSQVLVKLIGLRQGLTKAALMFQKEMAQRLLAQPCCRDYGRLSVMLQYCASINPLMSIKAGAFFPKPAVDSSVLQIKFKQGGHHFVDELFFFRVIKACFAQRRKNLKNALSHSELGVNVSKVLHILEQCGINPDRRAETLVVEEFICLSKLLLKGSEHG